ncbi:MAG: putative transposase, partial [Mycobacterium sp.]
MLPRVFGCCRVVFNDALRVRDEAYRAGSKLSDTEIQRRVITKAKTTVERAWLREVPSVALVQSVNDSRRAWRNFFDAQSALHRGRNVGRPRMKSKKDHRQPFPLTRNGFNIRANALLYRARRDHHHKQALALVRDNQVIHVEDLNIVGLVQNRRLSR